MLVSTIWRLLMNYTVGQFPICQMRCETSKEVPAETITSNDIETLYKGKMETLEGDLHRRLAPPFDYLLRLYSTSFLDQINTKCHLTDANTGQTQVPIYVKIHGFQYDTHRCWL